MELGAGEDGRGTGLGHGHQEVAWGESKHEPGGRAGRALRWAWARPAAEGPHSASP